MTLIWRMIEVLLYNKNLDLTFDKESLKTIYLARGCFWGTDAYMARVLGVIQAAIDRVQMRFSEPVVTTIEPLVTYQVAEEYHQNYLDKNPNGYCHLVDKF